MNCGSTSPGVGCKWMSSYTQCGPCASEGSCAVCNKTYLDDELVVKCMHCSRYVLSLSWSYITYFIGDVWQLVLRHPHTKNLSPLYAQESLLTYGVFEYFKSCHKCLHFLSFITFPSIFLVLPSPFFSHLPQISIAVVPFYDMYTVMASGTCHRSYRALHCKGLLHYRRCRESLQLLSQMLVYAYLLD